MGAARGNASEAARLAGYAGSYSTVGAENMQKPHIKRAVRALVRAETLGRAEVRHRLSQQARASLADVIDLVEVVQHVVHGPSEADDLAALLTRSVGDADVTYLDPDDLDENERLLDGLAGELGCEPRVLLDQIGGRVRVARVVLKVPIVNLEKARRTGAIHAIKSIRYDNNGRPDITLHDSQKALMHLDKMYSVAENAPEAATAARSRIERVTDKMGLQQINILNLNL